MVEGTPNPKQEELEEEPDLTGLELNIAHTAGINYW